MAEAAYPRRGQAIVPRLLAPLLAGALPDDVAEPAIAERRSRSDCRALARRAVLQLRAQAKTLPPTVTDEEMPRPSVLLDRVVLDTRTRNVLLRQPTRDAASGRRTVGRYLALTGFGARGLLDALTARDFAPRESRGAPSWGGSRRRLDDVLAGIEWLQLGSGRSRSRQAPPSWPQDQEAALAWFGELTESVIAQLPLSEDVFREAVPEARAAGEAVTLARIVSAANRAGLLEPLAVVALGGRASRSGAGTSRSRR